MLCAHFGSAIGNRTVTQKAVRTNDRQTRASHGNAKARLKKRNAGERPHAAACTKVLKPGERDD